VKVNRYAAVLFGCAALMGGTVAACGGDDDSGGSSSSSSGSTESGSTSGAKAIDPKSMDGAKGEITYCTGKDTSGEAKAGIDQFNAKYKSQGLSAKMLEFPADAQQQRQQFVQRQEAKSGECDVFSSDVVWTAEFANQKWLYDMTPYMESRKADFIPATLKTVTYDGKIWGAPATSDSSFIFYHTGQAKDVPATWQDLYAQAKDKGGIVYQGAAYEGLTCDFLEIAFAAGGKVLSDDGKKAVFDSPENLNALNFMVDGIKNGSAPKAVTTYMEEESRRAFENGKPTFMRNWTYAYAVGKKNKSAPAFNVAPLPQFEGAGKSGMLGGHNKVISVYSKNPGGALAFVDYETSMEREVQLGAEFSLAPTLSKAYDDPTLKKGIPYAPQMKQAIEQADSRPVSPVYPQISEAIYKNVNAALSGETSPEDALKTAQSQIQQALATF
jgi:multiple sugar transport system substrate-binding protein